MKNVTCSLLIFFTGIWNFVFAQNYVVIEPDSAQPQGTSWENGFKKRLDSMLYSQTFHPTGGSADPDEGKRTWPLLLAELYKANNNPAKQDSLIINTGNRLMFSTWAGSFYKPFSVPGYTTYYLQNKNRLPQTQLDQVKKQLYNLGGWGYLMRPDHYMDPIYSFTEFNSENFNWMARLGGQLLSHDFNDSTKIPFFDGHLNNMVRALYHSGRIEWSSNNYWGHTFQPLLGLHSNTTDSETRAKARAAMDWMCTEMSLHWLDGKVGGGDVRNKAGGYHLLAGSFWGYGFLYFSDTYHQQSYQMNFPNTALTDFVGQTPYSTYRPAQVIIDIALRNFALPLEIHSAKPYYALDNDNYKDWKGNTHKSRKFEFETIYMDRNYLLASLASNRPDGSIGTYSEESVWRFCVQGNGQGATHIFGNAGWANSPAGRFPLEEICQYRNVMLRLIKGTDKIWVGIPDNIRVDFDRNTAFADMGNDVYMALVPYNALSVSLNPLMYDTLYNQYTWNFTTANLGALALEVGTANDYGTYANFKAAIMAASRFTSLASDMVEYHSAAGNNLKAQFMPPISYPMETGQVVNPAGVTPQAWANGQFIDYSAFNTWEVAYGEKIIDQQWGDGTLNLHCNGTALKITINDSTAHPTYQMARNVPPEFVTGNKILAKGNKTSIDIWPNPGSGKANIKFSVTNEQNLNLVILDMQGKVVLKKDRLRAFGIGIENLELDISGLANGLYQVVLFGENYKGVQKFVKH